MNINLNDYKIPIITGKNDIPTTNESQPNHPNGSYFTAKYNSLIDNLNTILNTNNNNNNDDFLNELLACLFEKSQKLIIYNYDNNIVSGSDFLTYFFDLSAESFSIPNVIEDCIVNQYHTFYFGKIGVFTNNNRIIFNFNEPHTKDLVIPLTIKYGRPNTPIKFYENYHILITNSFVKPDFWTPFTGEEYYDY